MPTTKPALLLLPLLAACITPKPLDSGDTDPTGGGDGGPTVFDVNDGTIGLDEIVTLEGVVVTSPLNRDGDGFFVADPAGGANSGLYVWRQTGFDDGIVAVGDELTLTGTVTDYYGWTELVIDSTDDVTVTGEATVPAPVDLGAGDGVDWESYESVAVTLTNQTVTSVDQFGTGTLTAGVNLDDGFQFLDFDCRGAYASVSGIVFYSYEEYSVNPRTDADLGAYSAPEAVVTTVADIQSGAMCGPVILEDVVVTSPVADDDGSSVFFVEDAGTTDGMGAFVKDTIVDANVGDVVTLTGSADEFYGFSQLYVADPVNFVASGATGDVLGESLESAPSDWEPYEGKLVTLTNVTATSDQEYGEVTTDWNISVDDLYYDHTAGNGDAFESVTGLVYYSYEVWKIEPRSAADMVAR